MRSTAIGFTEQNGLEKVVDGVPIGAIIPYAGSTAPFGTLICNGAAISRSAYPELFEAIGTTWGAGDGSTTFNIPDLRGYFLRGVGGNSAGLAAEQGDAIRNLNGNVQIRPSQSIDALDVNTTGTFVTLGTHLGDSGDPGIFEIGELQLEEGVMHQWFNPMGIGQSNKVRGFQNLRLDASRQTPTAAENRPINKAVNYIIVYE